MSKPRFYAHFTCSATYHIQPRPPRTCGAHEFIFEQGHYGTPDPYHPNLDTEVQDEHQNDSGQGLRPLCSAAFTYLYDFGDGWEHIVTVYEINLPDSEFKHPKCIDGQNACPPEDVGGPWGYQDYLEAIDDPNHEMHQEMLAWRYRQRL
ncbi:MAG: plasmid pRiA4b ORF-3 family protein [Acidithiobacillus sp.]